MILSGVFVAAICDSNWLSCIGATREQLAAGQRFAGDALLITLFFVPGVLATLGIRPYRTFRLIPLALLGFITEEAIRALLIHGGHDCDRKGCYLGEAILNAGALFSIVAMTTALAAFVVWLVRDAWDR